VSDAAICERLKRARNALGEDLHSIAGRAGVAERQLRAIEDGRFNELPRGIYARSTIRSYAATLGLDPAEVLNACEPLLPALEEPLAAMGRLWGLRPSRPAVIPGGSSSEPPAASQAARPPDWRLFAAAALDAALIGAMLAIVIASAAIMAGVPIQALDRAAGAFGVMGLMLAGTYFTWLGGLCGVTAGNRAVKRRPFSQDLSSLDLRAIVTRACRCASSDLRFIWELGVWLGRLTTNDKSSVDLSSTDPGNQQTAVAR
jgi:transcriptional regulator with XRE-family HTH domain